MKKNLLLLFFALLFLSQFSSCSGKRGTTKANVLVLGAALSNASGGVMVYGHNRNTGDYFAEPHTSGAEEKVLELKNGEWSFTAISWQGADILEGNTRCAIASATLAGGDIDVAIDLAGENCGEGSFFGSAQSRNQEQQIKSLSFATCANDSVLNSGASVSSDCLKGAARSYQIILPAKAPEGEVELGRGLISQCVDDTTPNTALHDSSVKLPPLGSEEIRVPMVIQAFSGAGCGGEEETYSFTSGRHIASGKGEIRYEEGKVYAVLVGRGYCQGDKLTNAPFASGGFNSTGLNYICTADQLNNIGDDSAHVNGDYILMKDIDLSGFSFNGIAGSNSFSGIFYGNNKTIQNYTAIYTSPQSYAGFFNEIVNGTVKNLTFRNPQVDCTINCFGIGTLVGRMQWGTLSHIKIDNPAGLISLKVAGPTNNIPFPQFGGVVAVAVNDSRLEYLEVDGLKILHDDSWGPFKKIGGVIGELKSSAMEKIRVSNLQVISNDQDAGACSQVGGVVGIAEDAQVSNVKATNMTIEIEAGESIGGLIGELKNNSLLNRSSFQGHLRGGSSAQQTSKVGGAVGHLNAINNNQGVSITRVNATIEGWGESIGGFVGYIATGAILYSAAKGTLECYPAGGSNSGCGGIAGLSEGAIWRTLSEINISTPAGFVYNDIGGIAGKMTGNSQTNWTHYTGTINLPDGVNVGGLAGTIDIDDLNEGAKNNSSSATIIASNTCGGLVGSLNKGTAEDNIFEGILNCPGGDEGLLLGYVDNASGTANELFALDRAGNPTDFIASGSNACNDCKLYDDNDMRQQSSFTTYLPITPNTDQWYQEDGVTYPQLNWLKKFNDLGGFEIGSYYDPIVIQNASQWNAIGDYEPFVFLTFELARDIDFGGGAINPVGSNSSPFSGTLRGNHRVFKNGEISPLPDQGNAGLFRVLNGVTSGAIQGAQIFNVGFQNISVYNQNNNGTSAFTGILAGEIRGNVTNDGAQVAIRGLSVAADCFVEVSGTDDTVGGVIGKIDNANSRMIFENITNKANVNHIYNGACESVGGIVGAWNSTQTVEGQNITNHGRVEAIDCDNVGGIVGLLEGQVNLQGAFNYAGVQGQFNVGGLIGRSEANIKNSANRSSTEVFGNEKVGGIIGYHVQGSVTYVGNTANVQATSGPAGGVIGQCQAVTGQLRNSYNAGEVTGGANNGGLVGGNVGPPNSGNYFFGPQNGASTGTGIPLSREELRNGANLGGLGSEGWSFPLGDYPRLPQEL